jgi:hypothetical protein
MEARDQYHTPSALPLGKGLVLVEYEAALVSYRAGLDILQKKRDKSPPPPHTHTHTHTHTHSQPVSYLMMRTGMVFETLLYSPLNHLMRLLAGEYFIEDRFFAFAGIFALQFVQSIA